MSLLEIEFWWKFQTERTYIDDVIRCTMTAVYHPFPLNASGLIAFRYNGEYLHNVHNILKSENGDWCHPKASNDDPNFRRNGFIFQMLFDESWYTRIGLPAFRYNREYIDNVHNILKSENWNRCHPKASNYVPNLRRNRFIFLMLFDESWYTRIFRYNDEFLHDSHNIFRSENLKKSDFSFRIEWT